MIGQLCVGQEYGRGRQVVWGKNYEYDVPLFQVSCSSRKWGIKRRLEKANELLYEQKIQTVINEIAFPYWTWFPSVRRYNPVCALQPLATELVLLRLEEGGFLPEKSTVEIVAKRRTATVEQVACALAPRVFHLVLSLEEGRGELEQTLFETFGLAPLHCNKAVTLTLYFEPPERVGRGLSVDVSAEQSKDFQGISITHKTVPQGVSPLAWIGLLLQTEKITKKDILLGGYGEKTEWAEGVVGEKRGEGE